jgi:hypothetical protein
MRSTMCMYLSLVAKILAREQGYICLGIATCYYADLVDVHVVSHLITLRSIRVNKRAQDKVAAFAITVDSDGDLSTIVLTLCICQLRFRYLSSWALDSAFSMTIAI